ncbi:FAD/NAD(P)-binding domain-containing protein [Microbotryomycetes sp. JL201]|nr:FAD/NAD(P)-binding domain-containing protein [Microbotryomycetes sp. JL201]
MGSLAPEIVIVGAGLSGVTLGLELRKKGITSFTIYEKNKDVGGTWYQNVYPECACDVPSHWYSLSTELNPNWTSKYSPQPEILDWKGVYLKSGLPKHTKFDSTFVKAVWDEQRQGYDCEFKNSAGDSFNVRCDVLVSCIGGFSTPLDKPHGMKGIESFKGEVFHSARWRHDIDLKGKRVAVVGNGCSAAQFIPAIAKEKSTHVINFSRTPSWFMPRDQKQYSSMTKWMFRNVPGVMRVYRDYIATMSDSRYLVWMLQFKTIRHYVEQVSADYIRKNSPTKYHNFLVPKYPFGCKRVILDPGYLQSLFQSNVELVTDRIDTITEKGIRGKSGEEYEFDVLILATGFDLSEHGLGINVRGRHGKTVTEQWLEQKGPQAYMGTCISNFPSFYTVLGPNVASGIASVVYSTEAQVNFIVKMIKAQTDYGVLSFECKTDAEKEYNDWLHAKLDKTVWKGGCESYYKLGDKVIATFPGPVTQLTWMLREPKWEDFHQVGGRGNVALRKRVKKTVKWAAILWTLLTIRRKGFKQFRNDIVLFLLMRYQEVMGVAQRLRLKAA